ncbi:MAG: hypothetical protein Pg6C_00150 [Treponemataceae bacterium]|nr:MAG: hypothetical protein Pg6C_00150 [Treponemataceae bacterium]
MRINWKAVGEFGFFRKSLCILVFLAGISLNADESRPPPTLTWEPIEYAYCYEITIEVYDTDSLSYVHSLSVQTEDTNLPLPLPEGLYRYKIAVFNALDKIDVSSDWQPLMIRKAYQPQITLAKPSKIYLDKTPNPSFSFKVKNFFTDSKILLTDTRTGQNIIPENIEIDGEKISFTLDSPAPGTYEARVTNPGGLTALSKRFIIYQYKPWNIDIAFSPPFTTAVQPVVGAEYIDDYSALPTILASKLRFTVFPLKMSETRFFGFEILPLWFLKLNNTDTAFSGFNAVTVHVNLVFHQSFLQKKIALIVRGGAGVSWFAGRFYRDYEAKETMNLSDSLVPSVMMGATCEFFFAGNKIFWEASLDLNINPNLTALSPSIGIGKRF